MSETMALNRQKVSPATNNRKSDHRVANLISTLLPLLDRDQATKVKASQAKFMTGEIPRTDLIQSLCRIVGADKVKALYCAIKKKKEIPRSRQKRVADLTSALLPQLDSCQAMMVRKSYVEFTKEEVSESDFIRSLCRIAGADTVKRIVRQLKSRDAPVIVVD